MKKHSFKTFLMAFASIFLMISAPSVSLAEGGAVGANIAKIQSLVAGAASASYGSAKLARCSGRRYYNCIEAAKAFAQVLKMFTSAGTSSAAAFTLGNGGFGEFNFDPNDAGFCFDANSGCDPDAIDNGLAGFGESFATGEGFDEALSAAKGEALDQLKTLEEKGFKVDLDEGTITDSSGKVTSLNNGSSLKLPSALSKAVASKLNSVKNALGGGAASKRGVASESASSNKGGVSGSLGSLSSLGLFSGAADSANSKNKKKKKKGKFLAGLSDQDAGSNGVGFAGDDIFNMIQRRYTKKMKSKEFIDK